MSIYETRQSNLSQLLSKRGSQADFSEKTGSQASYINRVLSGNKKLGERLARQWEAAASLPKGYFDIPPSTGGGVPEKWSSLGQEQRKVLEQLVGLLATAQASATLAHQELLALFNRCSAEGQRTILEVARAQAVASPTRESGAEIPV